jgi:hypothetical protein
MTTDNESEGRNLEDEIRLRAYYRFLARGPEDGSQLDDWLRAAEELRDGLKSPKGDEAIQEDSIRE